MNRPICNACNRQMVAVNYIKENITHYRTRCDSCIRRKRKKKLKEPRWRSSGFKKSLGFFNTFSDIEKCNKNEMIQ